MKADKKDRAAGCVMGALIGDALGLGPHWYYDLEKLHREYGDWIDGYTTPKPDHYHAGMKAGELSQTGLIIRMLLDSVMENDGYDGGAFRRKLDEELLPHLDGEAESGPGGFTNHSFRQVWEARVKEGKPWSEAAGNVDTSEAPERCVVIAARHAGDHASVSRLAYDCTLVAQNDPLVAQQSVAFALVLSDLVDGGSLDEDLSSRLMERVGDGGVPFVMSSSVMETGGGSDGPAFPSPDALLQPSWIVRAARDPDVVIEPAWKASLVYGMSCAIQFVLPASYYLAARFSDDFESAVLHAINGGGQNMSRACMTGALVGAQVGLSGIPERFIDGLEGGAELKKQVERMAKEAFPA